MAEWKKVLLEGDALENLDSSSISDLSDVSTYGAGDAGKILTVNGTEDGTEWTTVDTSDEKVKSHSGDATAGYLDSKVDDTTIEVDTDNDHLQVKDLGIDTAQLAEGAVTTSKIDIDNDLDFQDNEAQNFVAHTVADEDAQNALNPVVGKMIWREDLGRPMFCTNASS